MPSSESHLNYVNFTDYTISIQTLPGANYDWGSEDRPDNNMVSVTLPPFRRARRKAVTNDRAGSSYVTAILTFADGPQKGAFKRIHFDQKGAYQKIFGEFATETVEGNPDMMLYQVGHDSENTFLIVPYGSSPGGSTTDEVLWMKKLPDETPLLDLSICGTHDSACSRSAVADWTKTQDGDPVITDWSETQDANIQIQMSQGCRFFDLRFKTAGDNVIAFHGIEDIWYGMKTILHEMFNFLHAANGETLVALVELNDDNAARVFLDTVQELQTALGNPKMCWRGPNWPHTLGDCRGKIIFITANNAVLKNFGIRTVGFPDNNSDSTLPVANRKVRRQDSYKVYTNAGMNEKWKLVSGFVVDMARNTDPNLWIWNNFNGSSAPLLDPSEIALNKAIGWLGINYRFLEFQREGAPFRMPGVSFIDFTLMRSATNIIPRVIIALNSPKCPSYSVAKAENSAAAPFSEWIARARETKGRKEKNKGSWQRQSRLGSCPFSLSGHQQQHQHSPCTAQLAQSMDGTFISHQSPSAPTAIPDGARIGLEYLAEGAANIIYKVHVLNAAPSHIIRNKHILRLSKTSRGSEAAKRAVEDFEKRIVSYFDRALLLGHILFRLPVELRATLNESLVRLEEEGRRPKKRCGVYLPAVEEDQEFCGILMPDFSVSKPGQHLLEFKSKWLLQSPSAPANAKRCRTCALKDMRDAANVTGGRGDSGFCPLDLLSTDGNILVAVLQNLWPSDHTRLPQFVDQFQMKVQPALQDLCELQNLHNNVGLQDFSNGSGDFSLPMALRDCSILMQISELRGDESQVMIEDFRFADLDLKLADWGKLKYWEETERRLVEEGWYAGVGCVNQVSCCALARM